MRKIVNPSSVGENDLSWLKVPKPNPRATWRLICLPHAGGAASFFYPWSKVIPSDGELVLVQYPGREERIGQPCIEDMGVMVQTLVQVLGKIPQILSKPYVLFGHSMGAAIAYELCLALQDNGLQQPSLLTLSAKEGPGVTKPSAWHLAEDRALLAEIVRLNDRLDHLLYSSELTSLVLPSLRGDYRLIETYDSQKSASRAISVPILVLTGREDSDVSKDEAMAWQAVAGNAFDLHNFAGGHFYLSNQFPELTQQIYNRLPYVVRQEWSVMDLP